jgi:hypothetical protein
MKHADIQKLHERRAEFKRHQISAGTWCGGSKCSRHRTAQQFSETVVLFLVPKANKKKGKL